MTVVAIPWSSVPPGVRWWGSYTSLAYAIEMAGVIANEIARNVGGALMDLNVGAPERAVGDPFWVLVRADDVGNRPPADRVTMTKVL